MDVCGFLKPNICAFLSFFLILSSIGGVKLWSCYYNLEYNHCKMNRFFCEWWWNNFLLSLLPKTRNSWPWKFFLIPLQLRLNKWAIRWFVEFLKCLWQVGLLCFVWHKRDHGGCHWLSTWCGKTYLVFNWRNGLTKLCASDLIKLVRVQLTLTRTGFVQTKSGSVVPNH